MTTFNSPTSTRNLETVAASQTAQVLGVTGGKGDYISHINLIPANLNPGQVSLLDGSTSTIIFTGGTGSVTDLKPFPILIDSKSTTGPWKLTTGASVSAICHGNFT